MRPRPEGANHARVFDDMKRFRPQEAQPVDAARLGEELREARLALGLSIEDVAAELRIRRVYLIALEEGRLKDLPSPAYAVGFVRNYSGSLGLDPGEMVRRLRDAVATGPRKTDLVFPEPVPERGFPAGVLVLAGAVVAIGAYVAWYNWAGSGNRTVDAVPAVPARLEPAARTGEALRPATTGPAAPANGPGATPPSNVVSAAPAPAAMIVPTLPVPTPVPVQVPVPSPPAAGAPPADQSRITLRAKSEIWTQVRDTRANQTLISRNLRPGESFAVPNREGLLLSVGNAAVLDVFVDGQPSPSFGNTPGVRRDVPLVPDQLRPRPAAQAPAAATIPPPPAAQPPAPARLNSPVTLPPPRQ